MSTSAELVARVIVVGGHGFLGIDVLDTKLTTRWTENGYNFGLPDTFDAMAKFQKSKLPISEKL